MFNLKKALCFALILCFLVTTVLAACSKSEEPLNVNTGGGQYLPDDVLIDSLEARRFVSDEVPAMNFNGAEFRIVTQTHESGNIIQEEATGDTIKDVIYERTVAVEDRFNIKFVLIPDTYWENNNYVTKVVMANEDAFDFFYGQGVSTSEVVLKKLMLSWEYIPYVDFSKPWWSSSTVDDLSVLGKTYLAIGDFSLSSQTTTYCMYYNKMHAERYMLPDMYDVVKKGQWTADKLLELTKDIYEDLNGDGVKDSEDFFGYSGSPLSPINAFLQSFDNPIMKKDETGIPQVVLKTPKMTDLIEKLKYLHFENPGSWCDKNDDYSKGNSGSVLFVGSRCIFITGGLNYGFRALEEDYGIIPYPKWDEIQDRYKTMSDGGMSLFAIPITASNLEMIGAVTEVLNAESWKYLMPAYYDIALKVKSVRDEQSIEMIELIMDGRVYDFGYTFDNWQGMGFVVEWLLRSEQSFETWYAANETKALTHYTKMVNVFLGIED
ncbi:MAG: hypothetical protein FWF15_00250 [Oscillospiraceae bacterium]|nr:hypothetical protein [Oscillospiraceae bacterium]